MRYNTPVTTMAAALALALALLVGVLLPSDSVVHAVDPEFLASETGTRTVSEDTPAGVNIGNPVSATDADENDLEYGNTLTYTLQPSADSDVARADAASFDIDASTGQLITKVPLDADGTKTSYTVTVRVDDDGETRDTACATCTRDVTITVTDKDEPPAAPFVPTATSSDDLTTDGNDESTVRLRVVWHEPENTGPDINDYDVQYKESTETSFIDWTHDSSDMDTIITGLKADTSYQVRVRAKNSEGTSPWSLSGTGSTNKQNNGPPRFTVPLSENCDTDICLTMPEDESSGQNVSPTLTVTDPNSLVRNRTFQLVGPDADSFDFDTTSRRIRTKRGVTYDFEAKSSYSLTATVSDGGGGTAALGVTITLTDVNEPPDAPARPTVRQTEKWSTRLDVSWRAPENTGRPDITGYKLQYREGTTGGFTAVSENATDTTDTSFTIVGPAASGDDPGGLKPGTSYQVQVQAVNAEGSSPWSTPATGRTSTANKEPRFADDELRRQVNENTLSETRTGRTVGARVRADQADSDRLTYSLGPVVDNNGDPEAATESHPNLFTIDETSGQIRTKELLNHEDAETNGCGYDPINDDPTECIYTVVVQVRDKKDQHRNDAKDEGADDTVTVKIEVFDQPEPPAAPAVTVTAPGDGTTLDVIWNEPDNTGPAITGYEVEYRTGNTTQTQAEDTSDTIATIPSLTANTSYQVRVRAVVAGDEGEGAGAWSRQVRLSTNKADNTAPTFDQTTPLTLTVEENTDPGQDIGTAVTATETDPDDRLTYSLEGADATLFTIVSSGQSAGQIRTKSALNHEDPACGYDSAQEEAGTTACAYEVIVKVVDRNGGSDAIVVGITIQDQDDENPAKPRAPTVTKTPDSSRSLEVSWVAPQNSGPPINDYDLQYREYVAGVDGPFEQWDYDGDETSTTITGLKANTSYEVQVRAKNGENDLAEEWSDLARQATSKGNRRPSFDDDAAIVTLSVFENTQPRQPVGTAVEAGDEDGNRLVYSLTGPGADSFSINSSGQILTKSSLDYESREFYSVTVQVDDGQNKDNSKAAKSVTIRVRDIVETPHRARAPRVTGIPGSTTSVGVEWDEPENTGPDIIEYGVEYRLAGSSNGWDEWPHDGVDRSTIITGLTPGTRYQVQVRARNEDGWGQEWSSPGTGAPNPDVANRNPSFSGGARTFSVPENTPSGTDVGTLITATDRDNDTLTYSLEGTDEDSFSILSTASGGQIRTSVELNHEEKASYSVTMRVIDGRGGSDAVNVTISVTDVDGEAPDTPTEPTVTAVSSTSLQVTWDPPSNPGPPITDYDYQYRGPTGPWTEVTNTTITATTATIDGLTPSTSYDVQVRAKNAEGTSEWSNSGFGSTNAPGANNRPVFDEGTSATRSVSAAAPAGTNIGGPIAATDADSGDTVTYSLEGRHALSFDINTSTGQLLTKSGVTLIVGDTYNVTVVADDTKDTTRISVSIEATAAPPNNRPVFTEAPSTTRSVRDDATAGRNIGSPVTATDADAGDTITYSLEGTDAASFRIVDSSGQIQTLAALDASTKATYEVTVRATDNNGGSATIAVTIRVTPAPLSYGCATNGAVSDTSNTGLVSDCEALMASRNLLEGNTGRLNWSSSTPINQWEGVSLRGTPSRVTYLTLSSKNLGGTIPADLGRLPMLVWLNLRSNNLSGSIPSELNSLTRLERLLLHNNRLSGPIPNLSGLRNLKMLWLSGRDMNLTGNLPSWLNSMSSLESLSLWGNELSGPIPRLTGMTSLSLLKLQSNNFTGGVPAWFGDMDGPAILYLHDNELTGTIPANLGRNTGVVRLWLDRNNLSGSIPAALGGMTGLRTLNLRDNQLTGTIPSELGNLSSLNQLRLHNNQLTGTIPSALANLSNLTQMWLSGNQLTGSIPAALGGMPRLRDLNLRANNLSGDIPVELGNLRNTLTRLRIGGTQVKDENGVVISEVRGNTGLTGCVPAQLSGATDAADLRLAGPPGGLSFC